MCSYKQERSFGRATQHASAGDFCSVFHQEMDVLYWLALTLTSDESKAEQCFVAGLGECIEGNAVFKEWARLWSRRVVIKNAIRLMLPRPDVTFHPPIVRQRKTPRTAAEVSLAAVAQLGPFARFVYVMSVLEGYADHDCATPLECALKDVAEARLGALQQVQQEVESSSAWQEKHGSEYRAVAEVA
jgi:hypothetical protein